MTPQELLDKWKDILNPPIDKNKRRTSVRMKVLSTAILIES